MSACPQCGFDYTSLAPTAAPSALASIGEPFRAGLLGTEDETLRRRPAAEVWSGLEYACHMRDVLLIQRDRLYLALVEELPSYSRMHRDERVTLARYNLQDPRSVADELMMAARLTGSAFGYLDEEQWGRKLVYNWPDSDTRDVLWLAAHTVHEGRHHLGDFDAAVSGRVPGQI